MQVQDLMTAADLASCVPDTPVEDVARLMVEYDCGAVPVIDPETNKAVGIITDRDIACRLVARRLNPLNVDAEEIMTMPLVTVSPKTPVEECLKAMEVAQVRRMPVVDDSGRLVGMVTQGDLARSGSEHETAELLRQVSKPNEHASRVQ